VLFQRLSIQDELKMSDNQKDKLVGTWRLVSASSKSAPGEQNEPPYGSNPAGLLTYTEDGRVSAMISYDGRKLLSGGAKLPALLEEQAEAFRTFLAYGGRYKVNGDKVIHSIEISSIQNYVNRELARTLKFEGDDIILITPPMMVNGKMQTIELVWRRIQANA
jgi:hypothetical protein